MEFLIIIGVPILAIIGTGMYAYLVWGPEREDPYQEQREQVNNMRQYGYHEGADYLENKIYRKEGPRIIGKVILIIIAIFLMNLF